MKSLSSLIVVKVINSLFVDLKFELFNVEHFNLGSKKPQASN